MLLIGPPEDFTPKEKMSLEQGRNGFDMRIVSNKIEVRA